MNSARNTLPRISIGLLSYNQEDYIEESLNSILNQDYPYLDIVISDDQSSDNTFKIIQNILSRYNGPHQIILSQNKKNLGIGGNRSAVINLAKTDLIISADGDDISTPDRASCLVNAWLENNCEPLLVTSDAYDMSIDGEVITTKVCSDIQKYKSIEDLLKNNVVFWGAANMYHKKIHEIFGHLNESVGAEDRAMLFRTLLIGSAYAVHKTLVYHRRGGAGASKPQNAYEKRKRLIKDAPKTIADIEQMIQDASKFQQESIVKKHFFKTLAEAKLTLHLSKNLGFIDKVLHLIKVRDVSLGKKLRIFSYIQAAPLMQPLYLLKKLAPN